LRPNRRPYTFTRNVVPATQFIGELASELIRQTNVAGTKTTSYLRDRGSDSRPDEALAVLIDELEGLEDVHLLLVLEDLHRISQNTPVELIIESLVRLRPPNLQLILTSRHPLPFGQARLVSQGQFTTIHSSEIAFDLGETQSYLTETLELSLSEEQTRYIHERTGGWVAAIGLAAEAMQAASPSNVDELIQRLTGFEGNIYNFLECCVLGLNPA
jgi:LuxR family maltose regulon positive regulatory protein